MVDTFPTDSANAVGNENAKIDNPKQVFVGNLAFQTTTEDLRSHFQAAGTIHNIQIIKRGTRPIGYGFIEFEEVDGARKAVATLNNTALHERDINVEAIKPSTRDSSSRPRFGRGRGGFRGRFRGRGHPRSQPRREDSATTEDAKDASPIETEAKIPTRNVAAAIEGKTGESAPRRSGRGRGGFRGRARAPRRTGTPEGDSSKTVLFVANIPFDYDEAALEAIFEGFTLVSSKVIRKNFGYNKGKSKGFGFVEFATEADQLKALETLQDKQINDRPIHLKIAVEGERFKAEKEKDDESPVPAEPSA